MNVMTETQVGASHATNTEALPTDGYAGQLVANDPLPLHAATDDEPKGK